MKLDRGSRELHDNKQLMTRRKGNSELSFPETLNIAVEEVELAPLPMIFHRKVYICYLPGGRSVWEKTVPEVFSTARGRRPRAVLKTKGTIFFPIRTDLAR